MSEVVEEMSDLAKAPKKLTFDAAVKFGVGTIICVAAAITVWTAYRAMVIQTTADAKAMVEKAIAETKESNTFIREQLLKQNERQGRMLALATKTIEINTEHLKQGSELMKATQRCLEECVSLYGQLLRLMEKVSARLDHFPPTARDQVP